MLNSWRKCVLLHQSFVPTIPRWNGVHHSIATTKLWVHIFSYFWGDSSTRTVTTLLLMNLIKINGVKMKEMDRMLSGERMDPFRLNHLRIWFVEKDLICSILYSPVVWCFLEIFLLIRILLSLHLQYRESKALNN